MNGDVKLHEIWMFKNYFLTAGEYDVVIIPHSNSLFPELMQLIQGICMLYSVQYFPNVRYIARVIWGQVNKAAEKQ